MLRRRAVSKASSSSSSARCLREFDRCAWRGFSAGICHQHNYTTKAALIIKRRRTEVRRALSSIYGGPDALDHESGFLYSGIMSSEISKYLARIGRKGGRSRSAAKLAAIRANLKRAHAARRKYKPCPRYKNRSHRFSRVTGWCACGYFKPACERVLRPGHRL